MGRPTSRGRRTARFRGGGPAASRNAVRRSILRQPGWLREPRGFASRPRERFALVGEACLAPFIGPAQGPLDRAGRSFDPGPVRLQPDALRYSPDRGAWRSLAARLLWEQEVAG